MIGAVDRDVARIFILGGLSLKPLPLPPPFPSPTLPLEVGPLIAARGPGGAFYLPQRVGRSPAAKRYLVNFRLKNLASSSNDLQELFRK